MATLLTDLLTAVTTGAAFTGDGTTGDPLGLANTIARYTGILGGYGVNVDITTAGEITINVDTATVATVQDLGAGTQGTGSNIHRFAFTAPNGWSGAFAGVGTVCTVQHWHDNQPRWDRRGYPRG